MRRMLTEKDLNTLDKLAELLDYIEISNGAVLISTLNNSEHPGNAHFENINSIGLPLEHLHVDCIYLGDNTIKNQENLILIDELPTSDPEVAGALWNDSGALKISAGGNE